MVLNLLKLYLKFYKIVNQFLIVNKIYTKINSFCIQSSIHSESYIISNLIVCVFCLHFLYELVRRKFLIMPTSKINVKIDCSPPNNYDIYSDLYTLFLFSYSLSSMT